MRGMVTQPITVISVPLVTIFVRHPPTALTGEPSANSKQLKGIREDAKLGASSLSRMLSIMRRVGWKPGPELRQL